MPTFYDSANAFPSTDAEALELADKDITVNDKPFFEERRVNSHIFLTLVAALSWSLGVAR